MLKGILLFQSIHIRVPTNYAAFNTGKQRGYNPVCRQDSHRVNLVDNPLCTKEIPKYTVINIHKYNIRELLLGYVELADLHGSSVGIRHLSRAITTIHDM